MNNNMIYGAAVALAALSSGSAFASCNDISRNQLQQAVNAAAAATTGGYGLNMWATVVDETGKICHVTVGGTTAKSGAQAGNSEWLGSRVISAQKANTANAFSLDGYAISTANLYSAVQPGGSLFGLQHSNPVDASVSYTGNPGNYGTNSDPLKNKRIGGVNVFGGGLALYKSGKKIGALGVSGDTSCRDHAFAWQIREALGMHPIAPATVGITTVNLDAEGKVQTPLTGASKGDEMILGTPNTGSYWNFWSQPACPNSMPAATAANGTLVATP